MLFINEKDIREIATEGGIVLKSPEDFALVVQGSLNCIDISLDEETEVNLLLMMIFECGRLQGLRERSYLEDGFTLGLR